MEQVPDTTSASPTTPVASPRQTARRLEIATKAAQVFADSSYHTVGMREVAAAVHDETHKLETPATPAAGSDA